MQKKCNRLWILIICENGTLCNRFRKCNRIWYRTRKYDLSSWEFQRARNESRVPNLVGFVVMWMYVTCLFIILLNIILDFWKCNRFRWNRKKGMFWKMIRTLSIDWSGSSHVVLSDAAKKVIPINWFSRNIKIEISSKPCLKYLFHSNPKSVTLWMS